MRFITRLFRKPKKRKAYEENAPGPFYVEKDTCLICRAPEHEAPTLMGYLEDPHGDAKNEHCYFKKQPVTPDEVDQAIKAVRVSCCGALRYSGRNGEIISKLKALGLADRCDKP